MTADREDRNEQPQTGGCVLVPGARPGRDPARAIKRGPSGLAPESVAATQRDRLYDGLVHTVAAKGYEGARVTDICRAAGVTRPVFYELFPGKEDAFLAAYRHGTDLLLRHMSAAYDDASEAAGRRDGTTGDGATAGGTGGGGDAPWQDGICAALAALLDVLAQVPVFATMAIVEIDAAGPAARTARARLLRRFHRFFHQAPVPPPPVDAVQLRSAVVGGVYSTVHEYVAAGRTDQLPGQLGQLSYCVLVPHLGPTETADYLRRRGTPGFLR
ncbi:TetR/AcrR family transcriptional regulator [Streptomyces sp. XM4193]|uniref:TetR/AcrR family transcriptional regulator n=1 Tax=Streptomyces sp. XM4193 TaxID=2929782 RepID=UPI001FFC02F9|nr:TetR/AcrR family transcriptional regulator [Streptomyces sp. XM4193]MCK1794803.1 TetR/AcrR family transcriptional regulator [Streptomyces sp. XM4193]